MLSYLFFVGGEEYLAGPFVAAFDRDLSRHGACFSIWEAPYEHFGACDLRGAVAGSRAGGLRSVRGAAGDVR